MCIPHGFLGQGGDHSLREAGVSHGEVQRELIISGPSSSRSVCSCRVIWDKSFDMRSIKPIYG